MLVPGGSWTPNFPTCPGPPDPEQPAAVVPVEPDGNAKAPNGGPVAAFDGMVSYLWGSPIIYVDVFWFWGEIFDWDLHRFATELLNWKIFWEILDDFCLLRNHGNLDDWMSPKSISFISWGEPNPGQPAAAEPVEPDGNAKAPNGGPVAAFDGVVWYLWYWRGSSFMLMFFDFWERFLIEICIDLQQSYWIEKSSERYWMILVCWGTMETWMSWMTGCPQNQFLSYPEENRILDNQPQPNLWNLMEMHKLPLGVL